MSNKYAHCYSAFNLGRKDIFLCWFQKLEEVDSLIALTSLLM